MPYNLRSKPKVDYAKLNEGLTSSSEEEIFALFSKSADVSKVPEQGACGGVEDEEEDSELSYLRELLAAEEKVQSDLKQKKKEALEAERTKEKARLRARLDKLRAKNKALAKGANQSDVSESSKAVTSLGLRSFDSLARDVEKQMGKMGLSEHKPTESDSDSDTSSPEEEEDHRHHSRRRRGKKLQSGKTAKVVSRVVRPQLWPQSELSLSYVSKDVRYDDLSIEEFVAGYSSILSLTKISPTERQARIEHLTQLMYLASVYEWSAVRAFHAAVLMEIERGRLNWGDSFTSLEIRAMAGCTKRVTSAAVSKESKRNAPNILFCREFQRGTCPHNKDHYALVKGERKWLCHICANCWIKEKAKKFHSEFSTECPHQRSQQTTVTAGDS